MTIFGSGLGPAEGVSFQLDSDDRVPTELAGIQVTVGGVQAPVLYVQDQQINFITPHDIRGTTTNICVQTAATQSCLFAYVGDLYPGIFQEGNGYAVLNEDETLNTPANPAATGSVISLFGTGFGPLDRAFPDGGLAAPPLPLVLDTIRIQFSPATPPQVGPSPPYSGEVLYAGAAPGLVNGVTQVNVRIPQSPPMTGTVSVYLLVDGGTVPKFRWTPIITVAVGKP
jgi:uncharacterized protein (TIGR03437 family)